jgi:hypothetical protein
MGRAEAPRGRQRHGLTAARRFLATFGARAIGARTSVGRALAEWRRELVEDLGGPEAVSTAQQTLIDVATRTRVMLDSIDVFILSMPSPVNKRRRVLFPVVVQRQALARELLRVLDTLGLRRERGADDGRATGAFMRVNERNQAEVASDLST